MGGERGFGKHMKNLLFAHANSHNLSSGHAQEVETKVNAAYFVTFIALKLLAPEIEGMRYLKPSSLLYRSCKDLSIG